METCNAWGWGPGGWVVHDQHTSDSQLQFLLRQNRHPERPDLINWLIMSSFNTFIIESQQYSLNCSYSKQPTLFLLKVLESGGWDPTVLRVWVNENYFYAWNYILKNNLALNSSQGSICHLTKITNQPSSLMLQNNIYPSLSLSLSLSLSFFLSLSLYIYIYMCVCVCVCIYIYIYINIYIYNSLYFICLEVISQQIVSKLILHQ